MLQQIGQEAQMFIEQSAQSLPIVLAIIGITWVMNILNWTILRKTLFIFGLFPRKIWGLIGIVTSPFLHGGFTHLFFNSFPFLALAIFIMNRSPIEFLYASVLITLLAGGLVWCFGRNGNHIGASGVIAGYFCYVLVLAYEEPSFTTLFCAGIALYYFSGILLSFIPSEESTSWEGHLFGLLAGLASVWIIHYNPYIVLF